MGCDSSDVLVVIKLDNEDSEYADAARQILVGMYVQRLLECSFGQFWFETGRRRF